jgi:hypothetical protein
MKLNYSKTVFMEFCNPHSRSFSNLTTISCNNNIVHKVETFKYLGIIFDQKLSFDTHGQYVNKKIAFKCNRLSRFKRFIPFKIMSTVFKSLVYSHIDYGIPIWGCTPDRIIACLQKTIDHFLKCWFIKSHSFSRYVYENRCKTLICKARGKKKRTAYDLNTFYEEFGILTVSERYIYMTLTASRSFFLLKDLPICIRDILFDFNASATNTRQTRQNRNMKVLLTSAFYHKSFQYRLSILWNKLPLNVKSDMTFSDFKYELDKWLISLRLPNM